MYDAKVDNDILQKEADKLLAAIAHYRRELKKAAFKNLSAEYHAKANGIDQLMEEFSDSLKPIAGVSIISRINENNFDMLQRPKDETDFGVDTLSKEYDRFFDLASKTYMHEPVKGFMGKEDHVKIAKQILHDYLDSTSMFYKAIKQQWGLNVPENLMTAFIQQAHAFISEDRGNVVKLVPKGKEPK